MNTVIRIIFFSSLVLLVLNSCSGDKLGNTSMVVTKVGDNLKSEINFIDDTIMHGIAKYYYYPTNILMDEIEYKYGIKEGWHKHYRKDGTLESKVSYKGGVNEGEDFRYYEDGITTLSESYSVNGKPFGLASWYYKNGQLELLNMIDFFNETFYGIEYDEKGNKIREAGVAFSPKLLAYYTMDSTKTPITSSVSIGKELTIKIAITQLPNAKTTIRMGELNKGVMVELPIENYTATYRQVFTEVGTHTLVTIGEIRDVKHNNLLKRDSITTEVDAIE